MSVNRILVAVAATVALLVVALPPTGAQQQDDPNTLVDGTDLVVLRIEPGYAVIDQAATIKFVIKNRGRDDFSSDTGWQLIIGYNSLYNCIYAGSAAPQTTDCYRRFPRNDTMNSIRSGETKDFTIAWTPTTSHIGAGRIVTQFQTFGQECNPSSPASVTCQRTPEGFVDAPDDHDENNLQDFSFFGRRPYVQAVPLRDRAPHAGVDSANDYWFYHDITAPCPRDPTVIARTACRPQPGQLVTFAYNVMNRGNWVDTFSAAIVDPPSPDQEHLNLTARRYAFNFSPRLVTLEPNQSREVLIQIHVPLTEEANNVTNVNFTTARVRWISGLNANVDTSISAPGCSNDLTPDLCGVNPTFPSIVVGVKHGLNATSNETIRIANVSQEVTFNITLNNSGNFRDTYSVTMDNDTAQVNASWLITPPLPIYVSLDAFEKQTVTLKMTPPEANATKGYHRFNLTLQSVEDSEARTRQTLFMAADVQQNYRITGGESTSVIHVLPAQKASYPMRIENKGNGLDNVTIKLENVPFGWTGGLSQTTVPVPAFSSSIVYLNITPPPGTPENTAAAFFVNATSQGPPEISSEQRPQAKFVLDLMVLGGPNLDVSTPSKTAFVDPGASTHYDLLVRNVGNQRSNFTVAVNRSQDQLAWTVASAPGYLLLDPLQSGNLRVTLSAPGNGAVGEVAKVLVTVTSNVDPAVFSQTTLEGQISGPDLFVESVLVNSSYPYSGDPLELSVIMGNHGNKAPPRNVTMKAYFIQGGVPRLIGEKVYQTADLPGGRRLSERVVWDTTGVDGAGTIVARVDEDGLVEEIDESVAGNEASKAITLRTFDIRVVPATALSGLPGEKLSYSESPHVFIVEYRGNQAAEPVDIFVESDHGWASKQVSVDLQRGSPFPVNVDVQIPEAPGIATDMLRLSIVPRYRPDAVITSTVLTTVIDEDKPLVSSVTATPSSAKLGEPITITANVQDATGLSSVRAYIATPANETVSVPLENVGGGATWTHTQPFTLSGTYRLYVEAIDGSTSQNKNSSRDTVVTFTISPGSAPEIRLVPGQSTTIKAGALVRLSITDPLGIANVTYRHQGINYTLERPFAIDTSGFPQGEVTIGVTAENVYGVATTATFKLDVDNTDPTIRSVTLNPARPKINQDTTLRIETDVKVTTVEVVVRKDGQIQTTREAVKRTPGVFELLINPQSEGDYTVDVTAKNAAGGTTLKQDAARFSAKPANPLPAWGALGAVAALAGVALALRRRQA